MFFSASIFLDVRYFYLIVFTFDTSPWLGPAAWIPLERTQPPWLAPPRPLRQLCRRWRRWRQRGGGPSSPRPRPAEISPQGSLQPSISLWRYIFWPDGKFLPPPLWKCKHPHSSPLFLRFFFSFNFLFPPCKINFKTILVDLDTLILRFDPTWSLAP